MSESEKKIPDEDCSFFDTELYVKDQLNEALGEVNRYFAGQELKHEPSDEEVCEHWIKHGGPENFERCRRHLYFKDKKSPS
ncbi:hypothetical protein HY249_00175 [Candidatus Azambacteria bacterium]|nr:hypothetical protein [Candidatus Azambacteria bacterium]